MLKKQNRLSTRLEFNITKKYGEYTAGSYFHLYALKPRNYTGATQVGFVISNKFHKNAVVRNRIKRLFREIIQKELKKFGENHWVLIYPKVSCMHKTYEEISADVNRTLQKISFS